MQTRSRLAYLDMTKGILVLLMVVYHTLNYTNQYYLGFRYLSFLPLSFIVITGFLLSNVYSVRYRDGDRQLVGRLLWRGVRLLVLFTVLNMVAQFVRSPSYGQSVGLIGFFNKWTEIYFTGGSSSSAFEVLLPIAYLLLIAPALIALSHRAQPFLPIASAIAVIGCAVLDYRGLALVNVNFVTAGILGMLVGQLLPDLTGLGRYFWLTLIGYVVFFPLGFSRGWIFLIQLIGAVIALALIVAASIKLGAEGWWRHRIIRIGQYSLVAYIVQIGILQALSRLFGRPDPWSMEALILFTITLFMMTLIIECTEWLRNHFGGANSAYKAVFA
jgi:peptidoglycan/LPS O-acetylase OafA/YrhL